MAMVIIVNVDATTICLIPLVQSVGNGTIREERRITSLDRIDEVDFTLDIQVRIMLSLSLVHILKISTHNWRWRWGWG